METATNSFAEAPCTDDVGIQLHVSTYERVASLLVTLLILNSLAVALLFSIWATASMTINQKSRKVEFVGGEGRETETELDFESPDNAEIPQLLEPRFEQILEELTRTIPATVTSLENIPSPPITTIGGDGPQAPVGEDGIIPRWKRWEIRWTPKDIRTYAQQLDFFNIELAAAGGSPLVDYAHSFGATRPERRGGHPREEDRLSMTWRSGTVERFDRTLLEQAGIRIEGRAILQFYPENIEDQLAWLELKNAGDRNAKEFLRTVFGVRASEEGGYEFYVIEQRYRPAPP